MKNVTLHELELLTGTSYQALKELLAAVPFKRGANRAHLYNSVEALRAIYQERPPTTLEDARLRTELLNARLKETELAKRTKGLVSDTFCFGLIDVFIKFCAGKFEALRCRGAVDREWISQCEGHWTSTYQDFVRNYDLTLPES